MNDTRAANLHGAYSEVGAPLRTLLKGLKVP